MSPAIAQDIETPWVRVDSGNPWLDLLSIIVVVGVLTAAAVIIIRARRK